VATVVCQVARDVVFSHQDLLCGNILYAEGWDRVQFIDFEVRPRSHHLWCSAGRSVGI
jgi:hypothetical protein